MINILDFDLAMFLGGTLAAALVTGLAGSAFGMVAAAIWLLVLGYAAWKLRHSLNLYRLAPFIAGSAFGIPAARQQILRSYPGS